jgi:hypothetical protein
MLASMSIRAIAAIAVFMAVPEGSPPGEREVALPSAGSANHVAAQDDAVSVANDAESSRSVASAEYAADAAAGPPNVVLPTRPALGPPANTRTPGVYVWQDPDGLWTVFWRRTPDFATPIVIDSSSEIVVETAAPEGAGFWDSDATQLTLHFEPALPRGILQFRAEEISITCNPRTDREGDVNRVYVGSRATAITSRSLTLDVAIQRRFEPIDSQLQRSNGGSRSGTGSINERAPGED